MEAVVEDVSMDTMVVIGGGGCPIFIHKTLNIRPRPQDLHPQNLDSFPQTGVPGIRHSTFESLHLGRSSQSIASNLLASGIP
ncbi:hypothetical protein YC2023_115095 [Brassica napus]